MLEFALSELSPSQLSNPGPVWIEALPARVYHTPQYGEVPVTLDKLQRMVKNFKEGIRGQEIATDFDHGMDRAKGNKASGWYRDFKIAPSTKDPTQHSLFAQIDFTEEAKKEIAAGEWKYFSLEWNDQYLDSTTGNAFSDVIVGGGITNRPVAKHAQALPINFSEQLWEELDEDTRKAFSVWSTEFVNNLPDSAFLYIQPGGTKDSEGKTVPRTNRHFPYKGPDGKIDLPHLRNAIARIPQSGSWLSDNQKSALQARARKLLGGKEMAERQGNEQFAELFERILLINDERQFAFFFDEMKEWEHSEPGTGPTPQLGNQAQPDPGTGQPVPRVQGDPAADDPAIRNQWRQEPLPMDPNDPRAPRAPGRTGTINFHEGMMMTPEQLAELYKLNGIDPESDGAADKLFEATKKSFGETKSLREAVAASNEEKTFAEQFPQMYARQQALEAESRENRAVKFSESVARFKKPEGDKLVDTKTGLSQLAVETVQEVHKKFSEGTATVADFEKVVKTITDGGIVEFGEVGSSNNGTDNDVVIGGGAEGAANARKLFAEKVAEVQRTDEKFKDDYTGAIREAARLNPELAEAYQRAPVAS